MQAILQTNIRKLELQNVDTPTLQSDTDVLLKINRVGVCGSDIHYYETGRIGKNVVTFPFRIGHECAATVIETAKSVDRVKPGDQVAIDPAISCGQCDQCRAGRENTCRNLKFLGCPGELLGCLSEFLVMPQQCLYPTHNRVTLDQAALCEPLSIGIYAVKQANLKPDSTIAILGSGPIGLCVMIAAKALGNHTAFMTDKINDRVQFARKNGAALVANPNEQDIVKELLNAQPLGLDAAFECAGEQETIDHAIDLLKPGGSLLIVGIPREKRLTFDIAKARRKELTFFNIRRQNNCVQPAIDLIADKKINADFLITHPFPLNQTPQAFDLVADYRDGVIKAMINL